MVNKSSGKISVLCIALLLMLYFTCSVIIAASQVEKHVLIINAFTPEYLSDELKNKGLKSKLAQDSQYKFSYSYEYLNLARFSKDEDYFKIIANYLKDKYQKHKPDFIFTDVNSYPLFSKYGKDLFSGIPVIMEWNEDKLPLAPMPSNFVAIPKTSNIEENIQLILQNRPLTKKIYIVIGDSMGERNIAKRLPKIIGKYTDRVEFVTMNKLPYEQMLQRIRSAESNSAVLIIQWFSDVEGKSFVGIQSVQAICDEAKVPVYIPGIQHMGTGAVGGYVTDVGITGQAAANVILNILSGGKPSDHPVIRCNPYIYAFDWGALKRWGIDEDKLPKGSRIDYREISVWDHYKGYIVGGLALMLLQALLIMLLLINQKRRKNAEKELIRTNTSLQEMTEKLVNIDRMKDEFLANTSHELQTPLNGIINISETLIEGSCGSVNQKQKEELEVVLAVSRRLSSLIKDIIDIEKIKRNEIQFSLVSLDIKSAIGVVADVFRHLIQGKSIDILINIPENFSPVVADQNRFIQVIYNLMGNAIKFIERGTITLSAHEEDDFIKIMIEDTGIGISKEQQEKLFNAFTQGDAEISRMYGGSGLGLFISRQLLERMGGRINLEWSELRKGSCFSFVLPKSNEKFVNSDKALEIIEEIAVTAEKGVNKSKHNFKVLAVDDESTNLRVLKSLLTGDGYEVFTASSGLEAIELIKDHNDIDLVLMDVMMPGMSGYEACRKIREDYSLYELPLLILTVRNTLEDISAGFEAGANDFVVKPFVAKELRARVATLLHMKKSVQEALRNEMAFLQAQIKPHFLYNTMSTIMSFCYTDGVRAGELLANLSEYLHKSFNIDNTSETVSLQNELELTKAYTEIEKARFGERLTVAYDVDQSLLEQRILPLTIQPLVENAIRHGIMPKEKGGIIKITVDKESEGIRILIEDNGVGMQDIEAVLKSKNVLSGSKDGVGILNIKRRLMKYYGTELCFSSNLNEGTKVYFTLSDNRIL